MKRPNNTLRTRRCGVAIVAISFVTTFALLVNMFSPSVSAQRKGGGGKTAALSEDQRILHVLNRLAYGARPGDVERVKAMGLDNYIKQQLNPSQLDDSAVEAKLKNLPTLTMTTAQLYEKYPQPQQLVRQLQRRGELPAELDLQKLQAAGAPQGPPPGPGEAMPGEAMQAPTATQADTPDTRRSAEYRQKIREYYEKNGLMQPQRIMAELHTSRILRAVYGERQLQEVMVDFWTNHFNVFSGKGADRWLLTAYDRDTIRPNALGKFSDLLQATAQSPAMLFYLDNFQSVSPDAQQGRPRAGAARRPGAQGNRLPGAPGNGQGNREMPPGARQDRTMNRYPTGQGGQVQQRPGEGNPPQLPPNARRQRRGINENYARELMELHTLGVDGGYTQKDVQEVARCFTGWTILAPRGGAVATQAMMDGPRADRLRENAGKFFFNARAHDDGEKVVLGHKIPAGGGIKDGQAVLDILAHHPSTAKYVATKLARYFVSDTPPPALVDRVAASFTKSDGDLRETLKSIFLSPEFNSPESYRAKVKRPFELTISAIRTLGGETTGGPQLHQWIARMGEPLYGYQTPNGYSDLAETWVNTGGLLERMNFGLALASNRIPGTRVQLNRLVASSEPGKSLSNTQIMERFLGLIIAGDISPKTKETLMKQFNDQPIALAAAPPSDVQVGGNMAGEMMDGQPRRQQRLQLARGEANITDPVTKIVGLILGSPEFQRQ
ncbi:MAG TPA: DUF1800 family protein [Pyrinomonadaceae bacterium]|nr:DUF1800 family protein [Pyrinomonadaceae bacterium]